MKTRLEAWVWRVWHGGGGLMGRFFRAAALPAERLYAAGVARRLRRGDAAGEGERVPGLRVLSVGNLAVGGTGKTPFVAWMARTLEGAGHTPAVLTRGYGRDEILLHRRWSPTTSVLAGKNRVAAARKALRAGADTAILDDGFQHRNLVRDVDVVLLAAEDPIHPWRLLPAGPYREPLDALERAHAVVLTARTPHGSASLPRLRDWIAARFPHLETAMLRFVPGGWKTLLGEPAAPPRGPVLAAAGVARPQAVLRHVEDLTSEACELMAFPDHHEYRPRDVRRMLKRAAGRPLVVTEKDAVKLLPWAELLSGTRVLIQTLEWLEGRASLEGLILGRTVPRAGRSLTTRGRA